MNYELAKQLKGAGFKQRGDGIVKGKYWFDRLDITLKVYIPTLEELIEACGEDIIFSNIKGYVENKGSDKEWIAWKSYGIEKPEDIAEGYTPSEAVAKLWLELNNVIISK